MDLIMFVIIVVFYCIVNPNPLSLLSRQYAQFNKIQQAHKSLPAALHTVQQLKQRIFCSLPGSTKCH